MISSNLIDSIQATRALEKLLATVRKTSNGDYAAAKGAVVFARTLLKNIVIEGLTKVPVVGVIIKAAQKTADELGVEVEKVAEQFKTKALKTLQESVPLFRANRLEAPADNQQALPAGEDKIIVAEITKEDD